MAQINSRWAATPIQLTEDLNDEVWSGAIEKQMDIPGGYLWAKNDARYLYVAIDFIEDTGNDPGTGDYFWFTFDKNRNRAINPNQDVNYGTYPGQPNKMERQYYLGPATWTGLLNEESPSACRAAFESSPNSDTPHRIWKLKFSLSEIGVSLLPFWWASYAKFGLRVHSSTPSKNYDSPAGFSTSFTNLHTLYLSRKPYLPTADLGPVMGSVGLIPTTKISSATGRATTAASYYVHAQKAAFGGRLNVIANGAKLAERYGNSSKPARKYKILHREGKSGSFNTFTSIWSNYRWNGSDYVLQSFAPDSNDYYYLYNPGTDFSIDDLLVQFDSRSLKTGFHQFKVEFYTYSNVKIATPAQTLTLYIDNNLPEVSINSIKHGTTEVGPCAFVQLNSATDGVKINFDAYDDEGNLLAYHLYARYGEGHTVSIKQENYAGAGVALWKGTKNINAPDSGVFIPPVTCAYAFTVTASARTTNGYGQVGHNSASRFITIVK